MVSLFVLVPGTVHAVIPGGGDQISCGAGTRTKADGTCVCKDDSLYLDESKTKETCVKKADCPADTTTPKIIDGQKVCSAAASLQEGGSTSDNCKFEGLCTSCQTAGASGCACTQNGQDACGGDQASSSCGQKACDLVDKYLNPFINLLSSLVGIAVVLSIILGGIQYTTSGGDPQKAAKAKGRITNSIVAMIAFMFLYAFLQFLIPGGILHP
jgi:hypothetical protein